MKQRVEEEKLIEKSECILKGGKVSCWPSLVEGDFWIELASPPCVDFSPRGSGDGWLSSSTAHTILWAWGLSQRPPDLVSIENVPEFDLEFVETLSGLKFSTVVMGPEVIGIPQMGDRLWGMAPGPRFKFKADPFALPSLKEFIVRKLVKTGEIFMIADEEHVMKYMDHINQNQAQLCPHPRGKRWAPELCLGTGYATRLDIHRLSAGTLRRDQPELIGVDVFFDISQNPNFTSKPRGLFPRPASSTFVWCESLSRPVLPQEIWCAAGQLW